MKDIYDDLVVGLADLTHRETRALPLPLRSLVQQSGVGDVVGAAQWIAKKTLDRYTAECSAKIERISLIYLCEILGIALKGHKFHVDSKDIDNKIRLEAGYRPQYMAASISLIDGSPVIELNYSKITQARISVAHEIGHYLIHAPHGILNWGTFSSPSSREEEIIAEYIGRLLLLPGASVNDQLARSRTQTEACVRSASKALVSIHTAVSRLADPDQPAAANFRGAILWGLNRRVGIDRPLAERLTPFWHICSEFVPIRKCSARTGSIVAELGAMNGDAASSQKEDVHIGAFRGRFLVDGFAWGNVAKGTRLVLTIFTDDSEADLNGE